MRPFIVPGVVFCAFEIGSISTRAMKICKLNSAPSSSGFKALKASMDRTAFEGMPRLFETQEQRQPVMWPPAPLQVLDRLGQMLIDFQDHGVFVADLGVRGLFTSSPCYRSRLVAAVLMGSHNGSALRSWQVVLGKWEAESDPTTSPRRCGCAAKHLYRPESQSVAYFTGVDPRGRHHCGPKQYIGKTPEQIVEQFKDACAEA